jgi:NADH kinase
VNLILENNVAEAVHEQLVAPVFTVNQNSPPGTLHEKVDLVITLGGDGTILRAASLFSTTPQVPPMLSFSMGTLGFLGEWKFEEYKRAFREVYMSGAGSGYGSALLAHEAMQKAETELTGWSSVRGKSMGSGRGAKVLRRARLKVGIFDSSGEQVKGDAHVHAMNEVIIHRGSEPHLAIVDVFVGGRFLTEAVADGMIVSTPTGSTAYSLSSGGSIIHPLVSSILLTPICPRSLSFRPLVLPSNAPITLRLSKKNRAREVDISIDGVRWSCGLTRGMEVRVWGEERSEIENEGGIPCIMRGHADDDDGWVGGLNGLLKFNYPFGEEA